MKEMALLKVGDGVLQSFFLVLLKLFYSRCSASPLSKVGDGVPQRWDEMATAYHEWSLCPVSHWRRSVLHFDACAL